MATEIIILMIALMFLIISVLLFCGKGKWLIAGYNTMSKEERKNFDEKKLCKAVGSLIIPVSSIPSEVKKQGEADTP